MDEVATRKLQVTSNVPRLTAITCNCRPATCDLLNDDRLSLTDLDLPDACRQLERVIQADALRVIRRAGVIRHEFLQQRLRERHARDVGLLQLESALSVPGVQNARHGQRHSAAKEAPEIERPTGRSLLADRLEVDRRTAGEPAVADDRDLRLREPLGQE